MAVHIKSLEMEFITKKKKIITRNSKSFLSFETSYYENKKE